MHQTKVYSLLQARVTMQQIYQKFGRKNLYTLPLSRNLQLITNDKLEVKNNFQVLHHKERERPLTLLFSWLMAKESHIMKYVKFYTERGIDVLKVKLSLTDVLWPTKGSQVIASEVLNFLHANSSFSPLGVHGFSAGAYAFSEVMVQVDNDMEMHGNLLKRFAGQIWDSGVDLEGVPAGLPKAITDNEVLQKSLEKYFKMYLKLNYKTATVHYEKASLMMHENKVGVPALLFFSKKDPVSTPEVNARIYKKWEADGYPVFIRCFESSRHVSHFYHYPQDYEEEMTAFLETVGMTQPTKGRAFIG